MTVLEPVCTCHVPGILGCAKHTWGTPVLPTLSERGSEQADTGARSDAPVQGLMPAASRSESVEPPCECPPGWQHQPTCPIVTGPKP
jgi:hypothetical protein